MPQPKESEAPYEIAKVLPRRLCDRAKHGEAVTYDAAARVWLVRDGVTFS